MKRNRFKEFFGAKYIANLGTKELHEVSKLTPKCRIEMITRGGTCGVRRSGRRRGLTGVGGVCLKKIGDDAKVQSRVHEKTRLRD